MTASTARSLVFVDEIIELRRLPHPESGVVGTIFRIYGFALAFVVIGWLARDFPDLGPYFYAFGYGMLALYLAVWLAFEFPSVFRLLLLPFSIVLRHGKETPHSVEERPITSKDDLTLCDPQQVSGLLTENIPLAKTRLRQHIESASNAAVVARSPESRVESAVGGLAVAAFLFIIGAAPGLFFPDSILISMVFLFSLGLAFWPIVMLLVKVRQLERQRREERVQRLQPDVDKLAVKIANLVDAQSLPDKGTPERFGLYLRPFLSTGRIRINIHRLYESVEVDFEMLFAYSLKPYVPVIALGQPGEHVGAGRINTTDSDWQAVASSLIENAQCVYIVPSNRPGTLWEVQFLRQTRALSKAVFIMPPEARMADDKTLFSKHWEETRQACAELGVQLPRHKRQGMLFNLYEDGSSLVKTAPLQLEVITPSIPPPIVKRFEDRPLPESDTSSTENEDDRDRLPAWASIMLGVPTDRVGITGSGGNIESGGSGSYSGGDIDFGGGGD